MTQCTLCTVSLSGQSIELVMQDFIVMVSVYCIMYILCLQINSSIHDDDSGTMQWVNKHIFFYSNHIAFKLLIRMPIVSKHDYWLNFHKIIFCWFVGDYASAIETLVTAISLIKQSKVANDDRCKVLVSSLQDCLHGIESKSYGSGSR